MTMGQLSLLRLLQLSDSNFPSGSFAFSNGLETMDKELSILSLINLNELLVEQILPKWFDFDRYFILKAFASSGIIDDLLQLDKKCHLQNTNEAMAAASRRVGRSLLTVHKKMNTECAVKFWETCSSLILNDSGGYQPVIIGMVGSELKLSQKEVEAGALFGAVTSFYSAAIRLNLIGSIEAQRLISEVLPELDRMLQRAPPDYPYSNALLSEIAASRHKDLELSLFSN